MSYKGTTECEEGQAAIHLGIRAGQIHPRILTVGSPQRAKAIAKRFLQNVDELEQSARGFTVINGEYKGVTVTIISIGMGFPNMDFLVKEISLFLRDHPVVSIIRLGTCGVWDETTPAGTVCIAKKSFFCSRNYCYFDGVAEICEPPVKEGESPKNDEEKKKDLEEVKQALKKTPYLISAGVQADPELTSKLVQSFAAMKDMKAKEGNNISCDTFYASQNRMVKGWNDENENLNKAFKNINLLSCEMETHHLFHTCFHFKSDKQKYRAAACAVGAVARIADQCLDHDQLSELCVQSGEAVLEALIS